MSTTPALELALLKEGSTAHRICKRCIMNSSDPDIIFDDQGICNHCKTYFTRVKEEVFPLNESNNRLSQVISRIKLDGQGKEYDCIIGVSGGVDSTYVAYLVKKHGLRPLAIHFDNGWNSELSVDNIRRVLDTLKIDLFTYVVDWEEFRDIQLGFLRSSIENAEIPTDHAINAVLYREAEKRGIKYIIGGGNVRTEAILPIAWSYYWQDHRLLKHIIKNYCKRCLKSMPTISLYRWIFIVYFKKIRYIPILNLADYNKSEAMNLLKEELGWREYGGKHYESIYTRFFQGYILPTKYGFDKRRAHLSCLVLANELQRDQALEIIQKSPYEGYNLREDYEFVIKKLGITEEEFEQIMSLTPKTYRDFPNLSLIFERLPALRKRFKKIATSVR